MDFIRSMFRHIQSIHPPEQPLLFSGITLQGAIASFRNLSGISREYLASRLFITHTQLVNLESRGKPVTSIVLIRLRDLSYEYNLPVLAEYFSTQEMKARSNRSTRVTPNKIGLPQ